MNGYSRPAATRWSRRLHAANALYARRAELAAALAAPPSDDVSIGSVLDDVERRHALGLDLAAVERRIVALEVARLMIDDDPRRAMALLTREVLGMGLVRRRSA